MNAPKSSTISNAFQGVSMESAYKISTLSEPFLDYARYELNFSPQTIIKYRDSIRCFVKELGDKDVRELEPIHFVELKRKMMVRGLSEARVSSVVFAVRSYLNYCKDFLKLDVIDPKSIRPPKRFKREVIYLTKDEVDRLINAISTKRITGLRFRAVVETLLGTGMRISEVLSLDRKSINWEKKEAKIIGKGNKERTVFFTDRSLEWIQKYLERRTDTCEALFIAIGEARRLNIWDISRFFRYHRERARIDKKLTPHIIRHTVATNLVFNGCPIVHVKEILGHEKLDTTCKYYLGIDKEQAKKAHAKYLNFV